MLSIYDIVNIVFDDGENTIDFIYCDEIHDYDDYIIVQTAVTIGSIDRGWKGNMTFYFKGFNVDGSFANDHDAFEDTTLKNVLCSARTFTKGNDLPITWEYKFLKY